jgi:hypothetical protein
MKKETIYKETEIFICENCGTSSEFESDVFICQQCGKEKCTTCSTREIVEREKLDELEKYPYKTICGECDAKNREIEITRSMRGYLYQINNDLYRHTENFSKEELLEKVKYAIENKDEYFSDSWESTFEYKFGFTMESPDVYLSKDMINV